MVYLVLGLGHSEDALARVPQGYKIVQLQYIARYINFPFTNAVRKNNKPIEKIETKIVIFSNEMFSFFEQHASRFVNSI